MTAKECVDLWQSLGDDVAKELQVPVYLYEKAAKRPERVKLQNIRHPEYEGLLKLIEQTGMGA